MRFYVYKNDVIFTFSSRSLLQIAKVLKNFSSVRLLAVRVYRRCGLFVIEGP